MLMTMNIYLTDMKHLLILMLLLSSVAMGGCSDILDKDINGASTGGLDESDVIEASLKLSATPFVVEAHSGSRASSPSDTPEVETAEEKAVHDIWVFQYDAVTEELLIKPRYYTISDQSMLEDLPVYLKAGVASKVYVVANTGYGRWADDGTDTAWRRFRSLDQLKKQTLPTAFPLRSTDDVLSIPMGGISGTVTVSSGTKVAVPVSRMYAKLKVRVDLKNKDMRLNSINVKQIPNICQVETLADDASVEPVTAVRFPVGTEFNSIAFAASDMKEDADGRNGLCSMCRRILGARHPYRPEATKLTMSRPTLSPWTCQPR